jgi:para-aminobenzoate synthetase component I
VIPLIKSIPFRDPAVAFGPLADRPMAMFLDSAMAGARGRFSYIATDPFRTLRCSAYPWQSRVDGQARGNDPFRTLAEEMAPFSRAGAGPTPFTGGAVGFFAYELGGVIENIPPPKTTPFPTDMVVGLYDTIVAFDLEHRAAWVVAHDIPGRPTADARATALAQSLGTASLHDSGSTIAGTWHSETSATEHTARIAAAIEAIRRGDIYQANITQRYLASISADVSSYELYLRLRHATPAPFAAFLNTGDMHILSASPERFLSLTADGNVETCPIKGTRPRGATTAEDQALGAELLHSAKDRAENLMIVDLLRNDLARVCAPGSIEVPQLCVLETFPRVHHLVSTITGRLAPGATAIKLLRAAFPGGSITGAPKIKAMEIIRDLEQVARGPYCGTIAWLGFDGAMDSSIVIRTVVRTEGALVAQAGGGIVAESDPEREYEESITKVKPLLSILGGGNVHA